MRIVVFFVKLLVSNSLIRLRNQKKNQKNPQSSFQNPSKTLFVVVVVDVVVLMKKKVAFVSFLSKHLPFLMKIKKRREERKVQRVETRIYVRKRYHPNELMAMKGMKKKENKRK